VAVESLALRDVMVPGELRRAAAEVATARAQGQAALERARGEVAATRALANAARMVADQPALLQLRTLQAVEAGGATVHLSTAPDVRPARPAAGRGAASREQGRAGQHVGVPGRMGIDVRRCTVPAGPRHSQPPSSRSTR
jgi:hypothetical protein